MAKRKSNKREPKGAKEPKRSRTFEEALSSNVVMRLIDRISDGDFSTAELVSYVTDGKVAHALFEAGDKNKRKVRQDILRKIYAKIDGYVQARRAEISADDKVLLGQLEAELKHHASKIGITDLGSDLGDTSTSSMPPPPDPTSPPPDPPPDPAPDPVAPDPPPTDPDSEPNTELIPGAKIVLRNTIEGQNFAAAYGVENNAVLRVLERDDARAGLYLEIPPDGDDGTPGSIFVGFDELRKVYEMVTQEDLVRTGNVELEPGQSMDLQIGKQRLRVSSSYGGFYHIKYADGRSRNYRNAEEANFHLRKLYEAEQMPDANDSRIQQLSLAYLSYQDIDYSEEADTGRIRRYRERVQEGVRQKRAFEISDNEKNYARALSRIIEEYNETRLREVVSTIHQRFSEIYKQLFPTTPLNPFSKSKSWIAWDVAKQYYLWRVPEAAGAGYRLANPMEDEQLQQEIIERHLGWELFKKFKDRTKQILPSVDFLAEKYNANTQAQRLREILQKDEGAISSKEFTEAGRLIISLQDAEGAAKNRGKKNNK